MNFIFLWKEELSLSIDLFCMQTDMDCLSYGHGFVLTAALQSLIKPNIYMNLRQDARQ